MVGKPFSEPLKKRPVEWTRSLLKKPVFASWISLGHYLPAERWKGLEKPCNGLDKSDPVKSWKGAEEALQLTREVARVERWNLAERLPGLGWCRCERGCGSR